MERFFFDGTVWAMLVVVGIILWKEINDYIWLKVEEVIEEHGLTTRVLHQMARNIYREMQEEDKANAVHTKPK